MRTSAGDTSLARGSDDDGSATNGQDRRSEHRRCRGGSGSPRVADEEGREAEASPSDKGAMRARGEVPLSLQGVQRLSARSLAPSMQGVRWDLIL
jgi:hypothetical protein